MVNDISFSLLSAVGSSKEMCLITASDEETVKNAHSRSHCFEIAISPFEPSRLELVRTRDRGTVPRAATGSDGVGPADTVGPLAGVGKGL